MAETSCIVKLLADAVELGTSDDTLEEITFPTSEIEAIEIKSLCAASKTFLAGQQNNGTLDFTLHYTAALNTTLESFLGVRRCA